MLVDTHSHIHDSAFYKDQNRDDLFYDAQKSGVGKVICVGTDDRSSQEAVDFAGDKDGCFASVAIHPHDTDDSEQQIPLIADLAKQHKSNKVIAVGECGLDYYYTNSSVEAQKSALVEHFEIAKANNLPMIFHVRGSESNPDDAFSDFWSVYDKYKLPGVIHSFSAFKPQLDSILKRGLYVGINGIITFAKNLDQQQAMLSVPLDKLLLETDSPFLTPYPFRGKVNTSKNTHLIADFMSDKNKISVEEIAKATTENAEKLFNI